MADPNETQTLLSGIALSTPTLKLERIYPDAPIPAYATAGAAGFDLCATRWAEQPGAQPQDFPRSGLLQLLPGQRLAIHTGWKIEAPYPWALSLLPRSGKAAKEGVRLANCVGLIDSDFTGELLAVVINDSRTEVVHIRHMERIAQAHLTLAPQAHFMETTLSVTARGSQGFGSTGA